MRLQSLNLAQDLAHDFTRSATDGDQANIAPDAADFVLRHIACATVQLETTIGDPTGELTTDELAHGDFAGRVFATDEKIDRPIAKLACGF